MLLITVIFFLSRLKFIAPFPCVLMGIKVKVTESISRNKLSLVSFKNTLFGSSFTGRTTGVSDYVRTSQELKH